MMIIAVEKLYYLNVSENQELEVGKGQNQWF